MRINSLGVMSNPEKPEAAILAKEIVRWCLRRNIRPCLEPELLDQLEVPARQRKKLDHPPKKSDLILSLGGDGYLLRLARTLYPCKTPVLPVNLGNLGFNSQVEPEDVFDVLKEAMNGRVHYQPRTLLSYELVNPEKKRKVRGVALNDVLIHKTAYSRLIHLTLTVDDYQVTTYRADGLLVASPTGSTAYNLSANGPILHPEVKGIVVLPICPHTLNTRCIVIPESSRIVIEESPLKPDERSVLSIDGQVHYDLIPGDTVRIKKASKPFYLAAPRQDAFYCNLREKLRWGGAIDNEKK